MTKRRWAWFVVVSGVVLDMALLGLLGFWVVNTPLLAVEPVLGGVVLLAVVCCVVLSSALVSKRILRSFRDVA